MKYFAFILLSFFSVFSFGQEMLSPLKFNQALVEKNADVSRNVDQQYIYALDTIHLPFKDDFSKDFFKKYEAKPTDTNVTDSLFYTILIGGLPDADTAGYMEDTTYTIRVTVHPGDSLSYDTINQSPITITHCNLDSYPIICQTKTVWPPTRIIDSTHTAISPDHVFRLSPMDIVQDSARVYFVAATDTISKWVDNNVFRNNTYPINPPTIGVATFDGLNENGYPYDFSTAFTYGEADFLTSKPLFLGKDENGIPYGVADSIYLSFYYQPKGLGDSPEPEDSLVLQFWSPVDNAWTSVWSIDSVLIDTNFRQVIIPINQNKFLADGFQFRFKNYASLSGSFDHWHLDYVYIESFRQFSDTVRDDVAFKYPVNTLLKKYTAVPWSHYKWDVNQVLNDLVVKQKSLANTGKLVGNHQVDFYYKGTLLSSINNPNTPSIPAQTSFTTSFPLGAGGFFYDTLVNDTAATFNITVRHRTTPDELRENDTLFFNQVFTDFYAYDDGSAEAAYGVQGVGGVNPQIASKFELTQGDTLKNIQIHFSPSAYDMSSSPITMTVWELGSGGKPGAIIHQNISFSTPQYNIGLNGYYKYPLDQPIYIPPGTYFVGWQQTTSGVMNVGYDLNLNNNLNTYYNSNGTWAQSGLQGTLMIRPSFKYAQDYVVGTEKISDETEIIIYPNPTSDYFYLKNIQNKQLNIAVFDINGKELYQGRYQFEGINTAAFLPGVYFVQISDLTGKNQIFKKLIKQ